MVYHWKIYCAVLLGLRLDGSWGCRGGSGRVVLIDNGRVYQSQAADALVQVKTTKSGTNVGLNMLLNISSRYFGGLFWSRQLRGLPSSDGYFCSKLSFTFWVLSGLFCFMLALRWSQHDGHAQITSPLFMTPLMSDNLKSVNLEQYHTP